MKTRGVCSVCSYINIAPSSCALHHNSLPKLTTAPSECPPDSLHNAKIIAHASHRSRSPRHSSQHYHRERSPHRHHHKRRCSPDPTTVAAPKELPFHSRQLTKRDYEAFKPMFALYLDIQKGKILEELDETEAKGRWKSFLGKW